MYKKMDTVYKYYINIHFFFFKSVYLYESKKKKKNDNPLPSNDCSIFNSDSIKIAN